MGMHGGELKQKKRNRELSCLSYMEVGVIGLRILGIWIWYRYQKKKQHRTCFGGGGACGFGKKKIPRHQGLDLDGLKRGEACFSFEYESCV